ncbi:MAG: pantoate--beta-alanine ligase [Gammaproteobacteria bacterium]|nr:pantoate--beta-alanine ligase [Gammaproteobacteria bacterium]
MVVIESISDLRARITELRALKKTIAFVPSMGNLHAGHLKLVKVARGHADFVVCSIFVNPMQFGASEDLSGYPRTPEQDRTVLESEGADMLFMPTVEAIYPRGMAAQTFVEVPGVSDMLCGKSRPGHFRGVTTVVNRLFNLVQPHVAVFGKKDYQQLFIIKLMVQDLGMPVDIIGVDTVRETDGLAMSSRNQYLTKDQRAIAPHLYETLQSLRDQIIAQGAFSPKMEQDTAVVLSAQGFEPDYVRVCRQRDLAPATKEDKDLVILVAARLGKARLIDNLEMTLKHAH